MKKKKLTKQDVLKLIASISSETKIGLAESKERLDRLDASLKESVEKSNERLDALSASLKESNERLDRFELSLEESHEKFSQELKESHEKFSQELKESHEKFSQELKESRAEFDKKLGNLAGFFGRFVEEMVKPNIVKMFQEKGIDVEVVLRAAVGKKDGKNFYEIDWLLIDSSVAVVVEVKSKFTKDEVDEHLERLDKICEIAPKHINLNGKTLFGAVAGIFFEENADRYAYKKGLYVLKQTGNILAIVNDEKFKPKEWKTNY